ncbi:MAG: histidine phosphatase family protein [Paracoccaceae bacterium]
MTKRVTLIAAAATEATRTARFPADEPLEARAYTLLQQVKLPLWEGHTVQASPKTAARQTAQSLALVPVAIADLTDINFGDWAGKSIDEVAATHPQHLTDWLADAAFDGHGGESRTALGQRAARWLQSCAEGPAHTIAVTHAAVVKSLILQVVGATPEAFWRVDIAPLTLTDLRHDGRRWILRTSGAPLARPPVTDDQLSETVDGTRLSCTPLAPKFE